MDKAEIAQRIANDHNRLASIFASGGIIMQSADSVIMMGDTIKDLRVMVQQIQADMDTEEEKEEAKGTVEDKDK